MQVTKLGDVQRRPRRVAVGEFDGVHLGHREVIAGSDTVLTFEPHPLQVVRPEAAPRLLTSFEVKCELIAGLGVEELVVIPFDDSFASQTPQEFIDQVLVESLKATRVSVGENFRFGHRAAGDPHVLAADPRFETRVVALVEVDGEIVSSSHIRGLVLAGEVAEANRLLGARFQLCGEVTHGDERGRELGFPTANLVPDDDFACPGHGVYACIASVAGADGPLGAGGVAAAVSIGVRPTFQTGRGELIEAYLLDFDGDLYGQSLCLDFLVRLRGERRFDTAEALVEQMHRDVEQTRELVAAEAAGAERVTGD
jgi:riboflavin kinase/FMN adenylyltransferase